MRDGYFGAITSVSPPSIVLRSGLRIESPLQLALDFVQQDGSYQSYDLATVEQDAVLTEADIRVANAMIARMSPRVIADIYSRAPVINVALANVPPSASLADADGAIPWQALEELLRAMDGIPEARLARKTKVLHKKRPALIPILDSVLETYLRRVDRLRHAGDPARDAIELIKSYKRELDRNSSEIQTLQQELSRRGIDLTERRLLDLFLWAYSETYTPLFRRAEARPPSSAGSAPVNARIVETSVLSDMEVEIFRDDDDGYLAGRASSRLRLECGAQPATDLPHPPSRYLPHDQRATDTRRPLDRPLHQGLLRR